METHAEAEERMVARCRARGVPVTAQRRAVLKALSGRKDHPTAEQVHAAAAARLPGMTRATVYRVLDALESLGLVRRVEHAGGAARYEVDSGPHHHLVCLSCGRIADVEESALESRSIPAVRAGGFLVREYSIQFRGLCASCKPQERRRK